MPFSKSPVLQTYETKRVSFVTNPQQRSADKTKDARLVNMMTEAVISPLGDSKKYYVKSRAGLSQAYSNTAGAGRGIYFWVINGVENVMAVIGNTVYANGVSVVTLATSTGSCGFTEFVDSTGVVSLIMLDGINGYVFSNPTTYQQISTASTDVWTASTAYVLDTIRRPTSDNGFVYVVTTAGTSSGTQPTWPTTAGSTVTDGSVVWTCQEFSFPSPHIPNPIYLDSYLFVAKVNTQDVYNSNLNDPLKWTPGDYFSAVMYPDRIVALSKNNNYIYAIGSNSVEYLYDAATAVGSPLGRHDSAVQQFGCGAPGTVVQTAKEVIFVGETFNGGHTVWTLDGFKEKEIGIPMVKAALFDEDGFLSQASAYCIRVSSQRFYVLCLTKRTLVYGFDTEMWHEWQTGDTIFLGSAAADGPSGSAYILGRADGKVYLMNENNYTDNGVPIECSITTAKLDFDNINRKFMNRLSMVGDVPDDTLVDSTINIQWSDNDYKTWSTARALNMNADFPSIPQLGQFRRRAFKITYSLPHLLRLEGMEVDINKGNA